MRRWSSFVLASSLLAAVPPARAWQTALSGTPPAGRASAVAVDANGDVLTVGRGVNAAGDEDALAAKLDGATGTQLWEKTADGTAAMSDVYNALAVSGTSFVAAGHLMNLTSGSDILLTQFDADGTSAWSLSLDGGASLKDDGLGVALDQNGDVLLAAQWTPTGQVNTRFTVLKRKGSDGSSLWTSLLSDGNGSARAVLVRDGAVIAAGDVAGLITAVKLDPDTGATMWRTSVTGSPSAADVGRAVAVGGGRVVVAGRMVLAADDPDFAVVALDATTGIELWRHTIDGTVSGTNDNDDAFDVAVDAAGDVVAAGRITNTNADDDALIVKLAGATGAETWRTVIDGRSGNADVAQAITLAPSGDVFVTGTVRNPGTHADFLVMRLASADGTTTWRTEVNGPTNDADTGLAIALDGTDVVAAGRVRNGTDGDGYAVMRRSGASGGDYPCGNGTLDPGEQCDDGNAAAGDGCRPNCTIEVCGDGIKDPQEDCDDGNVAGGDCCSPTCKADPNGAPCDDGDACTLNERCENGACVPISNVSCPTNDPCETGTCNPADGTCSVAEKAEGATCDDGNVCTVLDRCVSHVCTPQFSLTCDDHDPCTSDGCDPSKGCTTTPLTGFDSVTCTFQRDDIATACPGGLPHPIQSRVGRMRSLVTKASALAAGKQQTRLLRRAGTALQQAIKKAAALQKRGKLAPACGSAVVAELGDVRTRTDTLRSSLGK